VIEEDQLALAAVAPEARHAALGVDRAIPLSTPFSGGFLPGSGTEQFVSAGSTLTAM
jgi:hypothetical protein